MRFNRDIVECKVPSLLKYFAKSSDDLIETLWNVKRAVGKSAAEAKKDLIETLWNVKYEPYHEQTITLPDLIETLWNVKVRKVWDTVRRFLI